MSSVLIIIDWETMHELHATHKAVVLLKLVLIVALQQYQYPAYLSIVTYSNIKSYVGLAQQKN